MKKFNFIFLLAEDTLEFIKSHEIDIVLDPSSMSGWLYLRNHTEAALEVLRMSDEQYNNYLMTYILNDYEEIAS